MTEKITKIKYNTCKRVPYLAGPRYAWGWVRYEDCCLARASTYLEAIGLGGFQLAAACPFARFLVCMFARLLVARLPVARWLVARDRFSLLCCTALVAQSRSPDTRKRPADNVIT